MEVSLFFSLAFAFMSKLLLTLIAAPAAPARKVAAPFAASFVESLDAACAGSERCCRGLLNVSADK